MSSRVDAILVADGLGKTFERGDAPPIDVLKAVTLEVHPGDRLAILGKSGTGKSTLLHILGTLESPTSGKVLYLGQDVFQYDEARLAGFRNRELGFVFQFHYLMVEFTALENVMMPGLLAGWSRNQARDKARSLLSRVGLDDRLNHKPGQLSGGEQQRVAIARALMMDPKVLLTDEMTGNLDPATGRRVFDLLQELHQESGSALISVTHDEQLAKQYSRTFRLTDGFLKESNA